MRITVLGDFANFSMSHSSVQSEPIWKSVPRLFQGIHFACHIIAKLHLRCVNITHLNGREHREKDQNRKCKVWDIQMCNLGWFPGSFRFRRRPRCSGSRRWTCWSCWRWAESVWSASCSGWRARWSHSSPVNHNKHGRLVTKVWHFLSWYKNYIMHMSDGPPSLTMTRSGEMILVRMAIPILYDSESIHNLWYPFVLSLS